MKLKVYPDYDSLSQAAAGWVAQLVRRTPTANLVFAVGNTPEGAFRELAGLVQRGELDMRRVRVFQLDEYLGVPPDDARALYRWLRQSCLEPMSIPEAQVVQMRGDSPDPIGLCRAVESRIEAVGGLDAAMLGLGPNGHLGFNEPGSPFDSPARVVQLAPASVRSSAAYWGSEDRVPRSAMTLGLRVLRQARHVLLIASGEHKAAILARTLGQPATVDIPATCLRDHPEAVAMADVAAASGPTGAS